MTANLDLVRSIYAAWARGDFTNGEWADDDIEWVSVDGPDPGRMSGVAAVTELNRDFLSAWREWRVIAEEIRALDDERTLVLTRRIGQGKVSGAEVDEPAANVVDIRDGRVYRLTFYWDRERAFADLGLER